MSDILAPLVDLFKSTFNSGATFLNNHGLAGWIIVLILIIWITKPFSEAFDIWKARFVTPIAKAFKFRWAIRAANKYDVRGYANKAIRQLAPHLPEGWICELDIKWVNNETRAQFFENGKVVVRMRPLEDQDTNFVNVVHLFLQEALFPKVRSIIPEMQRMAAVLYFGGRIAEARGGRTSDRFGERIFEPIITRRKKILEYFTRYSKLDGKGFFSGIFIREIQYVAREVRATRHRDNMSVEMNAALTHLEDFSKSYDKARAEHIPMPETAWTRNGITAKYGLLLVADPRKAATDELGAGYVTRALQHRRDGARRLYVLGTAGQLAYVKQVIQEISEKTPYVLEQRFELYRDYRGDAGGIGALFVLPDETPQNGETSAASASASTLTAGKGTKVS